MGKPSEVFSLLVCAFVNVAVLVQLFDKSKEGAEYKVESDTVVAFAYTFCFVGTYKVCIVFVADVLKIKNHAALVLMALYRVTEDVEVMLCASTFALTGGTSFHRGYGRVKVAIFNNFWEVSGDVSVQDSPAVFLSTLQPKSTDRASVIDKV